MDRERQLERNPELPETVNVLGLPLARMTFSETLDQVERLVEARKPAFFVTAPLNYAMLSARNQELAAINREAAFLLADGMPLVWLSWLKRRPLPQRVAGSDLIPALGELAARRQYRLFLLGGAPGVAQQAGENLVRRYPGLNIVGVECPQVSELSSREESRLMDRIRASEPDLLFAALGQPKGELWLARRYRSFGHAVSVQGGASLDFAAGRVPRAPRWMQKTGTEWLYRFKEEPKRLGSRYFANAVFLLRHGLVDLFRSTRPPATTELVSERRAPPTGARRQRKPLELGDSEVPISPAREEPKVKVTS